MKYEDDRPLMRAEEPDGREDDQDPEELHAFHSPPRQRRSCIPSSRRSLILSVVAATILLLSLVILVQDGTAIAQAKQAVTGAVGLGDTDAGNVFNGDTPLPGTHWLLPASNSNVNLCKTLLGAAIAGFPTPSLVAWNDTHDSGDLLAGGAHIAKIGKVLDYVKSLAPEQDEDLVIMMDAYDIWPQLPFRTMLERYYAVNRDANARLEKEMGRAFKAEGIKQTILFGAGKRCAPVLLYTAACYPLPESPLPEDLYYGNTDTELGRDPWTSYRQRFVNSGFVMGPAKDIRALFEQAWARWENHQEANNYEVLGSASERAYHGSDQSIFADIFGAQSYQREVMRLRHVSWLQRILHPFEATTPRKTIIHGIPVDNILNPSITHEPLQPLPGKPAEFGMGLDYASDIIHQTIHSQHDVSIITFNQPLLDQAPKGSAFDCKMHLPDHLPADLTSLPPPVVPGEDSDLSRPLLNETQWTDLPLYINLCIGTIPVMIHHNDMDKSYRERVWPHVWFQPQARALLRTAEQRAQAEGARPESWEQFKQDPGFGSTGAIGAWTDKDQHLAWNDLCPVEYDQELYREETSA